MNNYKVFTDSCCDLTQEVLKNLSIGAVQLLVTVNDDEPVKCKDINADEMYVKLKSGGIAKTSAPSIEDFKDMFRPALADGNDLVYISFSAGLSCTYSVGKLACEELNEEFPDRRVVAIDSVCGSLGQGILIEKIAEQRDNGATLDEIIKFIDETHMTISHWFTVDDLHYLHRGGRVNSATAVIGSVLGIKPVLHMDEDGHLVPIGKARGRKKSLDAIIELAVTNAANIPNQKIYVGYTNCLDDANYIKDALTSAGANNVCVHPVGPVTGAHSGPGGIVVFLEATKR